LKLLVDENLPPRLARDLADLFPDSLHVTSAGLTSAPDEAIWEYARKHGFIFVTKDKDFANLSIVLGPPPKVVLLQTGNCSTTDVARILRHNAVRLSEFESSNQRSLLVLR